MVEHFYYNGRCTLFLYTTSYKEPITNYFSYAYNITELEAGKGTINWPPLIFVFRLIQKYVSFLSDCHDPSP